MCMYVMSVYMTFKYQAQVTSSKDMRPPEGPCDTLAKTAQLGGQRPAPRLRTSPPPPHSAITCPHVLAEILGRRVTSVSSIIPDSLGHSGPQVSMYG